MPVRAWGLAGVAIAVLGIAAVALGADPPPLLTGQATFGDWHGDAPGVRRKITAADLPPPFATPSVRESARVVSRPAGAALSLPPGFSAALVADRLDNPRAIRVAPNGDIFLAESRANRVRVLRASGEAVKPEQNEIFASRLSSPFGIAFYPPGPDPQFVYVAEPDAIKRFPYRSGDLKASGPAETVVSILTGSGSGHWTRDIAFSADGKRMFVSVGSASNAGEGLSRWDEAKIKA